MARTTLLFRIPFHANAPPAFFQHYFTEQRAGQGNCRRYNDEHMVIGSTPRSGAMVIAIQHRDPVHKVALLDFDSYAEILRILGGVVCHVSIDPSKPSVLLRKPPGHVWLITDGSELFQEPHRVIAAPGAILCGVVEVTHCS